VGSSGAPALAGGPSIVIIDLNDRTSRRTSSMGRPFTAADIIEADDWLIEQPRPEIFRSSRTPSRTSRKITISSPQRGLKPSTRCAGGTGSSPRLRGER